MRELGIRVTVATWDGHTTTTLSYDVGEVNRQSVLRRIINDIDKIDFREFENPVIQVEPECEVCGG